MGNIFAGGVIRNCYGHWLKGFACPLGKGTELWGLYIGIQVALEAGYLCLEIESDCLYAVNLLKLNDVLNCETHHYASIIVSCRLELAKLRKYKVSHVSREGNMLADRMACFASFNCNSLVVLDSMPPFVSVSFLADCIGFANPRRRGIG